MDSGDDDDEYNMSEQENSAEPPKKKFALFFNFQHFAKTKKTPKKLTIQTP